MAGDSQPKYLSDENIHVELTEDPLDVLSIMDRVRSPKAGAIVFFAGAKLVQSDLKSVKKKFGLHR